jgi:hypothetical protein
VLWIVISITYSPALAQATRAYSGLSPNFFMSRARSSPVNLHSKGAAVAS